jgi:hypothetical protein
MAAQKVSNRYPRPGERIAPLALRDILAHPMPKRFRDRLDSAEPRLCDLDESFSRRFPAETIKQLAQAVVDCISTYQSLRALRDRSFPRLKPGLRLDDLNLENRTRRCLIREGLDDRPERLAEYTLGEILSLRGFGPRCLLDLLSALESVQKTAGGGKKRGKTNSKLSAELLAEAGKLAALEGVKSVGRDDPRFGRMMIAIDGDTRTALELAERIRTRALEPIDISGVLEQLRQLRTAIERLPRQTLEDELIQIFAVSRSERNREILIGYYGWEDGQTHTLTQVGDHFGITRERVRQICAKLTKKCAGKGTFLTPVMDRTLALIEKRMPAAAAIIEAEMAEKGLTAVGMSVEAVAAGAKLLGRTVRFNIVKVEDGPMPTELKLKTKGKPAPVKYANKHEGKDYMVVRPEQVNAVGAIADQAKKEVYFHGLATLARMERGIARRFPTDKRLIRQVLMLIGGFHWLDESAGWYTIQGIAKHGLPKAIDKVLAVAGEVTVSMLRAALSRNRRLWREPPPEKVLLEYCRLMPGVRIEENRIRSEPPRNWKKVLNGVELKLIGVLKKHGPLMDRGVMEDLCVSAGMNRFSFHAFVSWSPVIEQFGHSLYGPLGAKVTQEQIDKMLTQRRTNRASQRVLDEHGVTEDGKVWLKYKLSKAASTYAVITIPSALKKIVRGRFKLVAEDGHSIGTLATKDGRAWGLGAYLRQCGATFSDQVALTIDLSDRTATVTWQEGTRVKG